MPVSELLIALEVDGDGAHPAAWRQSGRAPGDVLTARATAAIVASAEAAGVALVTFDDAPTPPSDSLDAAGRIEAGSRAAYVSTLTDRIGLAPTLHATVTEPFHLATQLASLDWATNGRGAWVVGAANDADGRATIGEKPLSADALHRELSDVVDVARALWDSWEDDAVIKDGATGRYLDPQKVHPVSFTGADFTITGPLITPRPPQGQLVVLAADALGLADRADIVLISAPDTASIADRAQEAKAAGAALAFAELQVVLDAGHSAAARLAELDESTTWRDDAKLRYIGSATGLVDLLTSLSGIVDGVRLHLAVHAIDLPILAEQVLPALTAAGVHRAPQAGDTLRQTLGLSRPISRFAALTSTGGPR
ncbi:MAG: hypothetical protein JWN61_1280 [Pseudonocardiales bacterium]|nr:hypothetical protein [Pseudonocardiales bacterium]